MPESNNDAQIMGAEMFKRMLEQANSGKGIVQNEVYTDKEKSISDTFNDAMNDIQKKEADKIIWGPVEKVTFNDYQEFVKTMKVYPEKYAIVYPTLGISGEAGEVAEKVKKYLRGDKELDKLELLKEAGDVLWYLASLADDLGYSFQEMVNQNVKKLSSRKERGVQKGDGDNR